MLLNSLPVLPFSPKIAHLVKTQEESTLASLFSENKRKYLQVKRELKCQIREMERQEREKDCEIHQLKARMESLRAMSYDED